MSQAPRISPALWEAQRPRITDLYVNQDKTLDEVIQIMAESGFHATKAQYIRKVNVNWKLQKYYTKEKWQHASALVAKRQAEGKITELSIDGKVISEKRQKKELRRYHAPQTEEDSVGTSHCGVVAFTPPSSNPIIVLTNGLPWLRFRENFNILIKSQAPLFRPNQQHESLGFWEATNPLLSGVHSNWEMTTGSLSLPEPAEAVPDLTCTRLDITRQRLFELLPTLDCSLTSARHEEPLWLQIINSLVFLCSNNLTQTRDATYELLWVAISSDFLSKMKHILVARGPTIKIFARHLLFVALSVDGSQGVEFIHFLLKSGVSPDSTDPNEHGRSALHEAVRVRNREAVQLLLKFGADPNGKIQVTGGNELESPLNYSLEWGGDREIAKMLIESGADINYGYEKPLSRALRMEDLALVKYMLKAGADLKMLPANGLSLLYSAIKYRELSQVNILIEAGVDPNLLIEELHDEDVRFLVHELGMILTPLHYAVLSGNVGIVKCLIQGGAAPDKFIDPEVLKKTYRIQPSNITPLQMSIKENKDEITKILLDAGAGADFRHPATGTALQLVCSSTKEEAEKMELTEALLAKGADINSLPGEPGGRTAMQAAAESGHHDLLKLLLTRGGNPFASAAKKNGLTVFQAALKSRSAELVAYVFWELGSSCSCFSFFDGTNYLEEAVSTGDRQLLDTVLEFWSRHGLHWPKEFISPALKTAVCKGFIYLTRSFALPEEDASSLICESIWNVGTANTRTFMYDGGETPSVWCRDTRVFDFLMQHFLKPNIDCAQPGYPTPLWLATHQGESYVAERLLNAGANPNKPSPVVCRDRFNRCCHDKRPEMPLKQAICRFDNRFIELLTDKGANINCLVDGSLTPLLVSLEKRNENAVVFLLSKGADPNVMDISGRYTALGLALGRHASLSTVQVLIHYGADVNMPSIWGTPLEQAARNSIRHDDMMERCQLLLAAGADVNSSIAWTALMSATANKQLELFKLLIEAGADVNASKAGMTALQLAVRDNNLELAVFLLEKGADVNDPTFGGTELQGAAILGNLKLVKLLIDRGADVDAKAGSRATALQCAAMKSSVEIIKYLVEHRASVNEEASPYCKRTALRLAITNNRTQAAILLIANGASVNEYPTTGDATTLLQLATKQGNYEIMTYLVENGATVNAAPATEGGATALQFAAINGNIKMAIFLIEHGARVSAKGAETDGRTALEGAAEHGRLDMVYLLLDNDEEPDSIEERCRNAAGFAEAEHHDVIAEILREYKKP